MSWCVVVNGQIEKEYPFRLQAIIHCYEAGYVWTNYKFGDNLYNNQVKIVERRVLESVDS